MENDAPVQNVEQSRGRRRLSEQSPATQTGPATSPPARVETDLSQLSLDSASPVAAGGNDSLDRSPNGRSRLHFGSRLTDSNPRHRSALSNSPRQLKSRLSRHGWRERFLRPILGSPIYGGTPYRIFPDLLATTRRHLSVGIALRMLTL